MSAARDDIMTGLTSYEWTDDQAAEAIRDLLYEHEQKVLAQQAELMLAAERSKFEQIDELRHQLNVAKLQVQRAESAGELMSGTLHGVRVTQHEQAAALRAIRSEASVSPDSTLKNAVQHILKGLEL